MAETETVEEETPRRFITGMMSADDKPVGGEGGVNEGPTSLANASVGARAQCNSTSVVAVAAAAAAAAAAASTAAAKAKAKAAASSPAARAGAASPASERDELAARDRDVDVTGVAVLQNVKVSFWLSGNVVGKGRQRFFLIGARPRGESAVRDAPCRRTGRSRASSDFLYDKSRLGIGVCPHGGPLRCHGRVDVHGPC